MLEKFKNIALFSGIDDGYLDSLETECSEVTLSAGEYLFRQGDVGKGMFIIISGSIEILMANEHGQDKLITVLTQGSPFGEVSLLEKQLRIASARAKTDTKLLYLDIKKFSDHINNKDPNALRISYNIAITMVDRLEKANHLLTNLQASSTQKGDGDTKREVLRFKEKLLNEGLF